MAIDTIKATAILDGAVDTADLADDAVTTAKINAGAVDTTELADDAVTTAKINAGAVDTTELADDAVTSAKLDTNIDIAGTLDVTSTLTADGNVLVGTTSTDPDVEGVRLVDGGASSVVRDDGLPLYVVRNTSDGKLIEFRKDGTTVGHIGIVSGTSDNIYLTGNSTHGGIQFGNTIVTAARNGVPIDNTVDLGTTAYRWKDLFLSGGAYLGGTGSANYLDDYEEGTWTPGIESSGGTSLTVTSNSGMYTKIGRFVMVTFRMNVTSSGSGVSSQACVTGLPFTAYSNISPATTLDYSGFGVSCTNVTLTSGDVFAYWIDGGESRLRLATHNTGLTYEMPLSTFSGNESMRMTAYYFTS